MGSRFTVLAAVTALLAGACGGGSDSSTPDDALGGDIVALGDVTLGDDELPSTTTSTPSAGDGAGGATEGEGSPALEETDDTIPQTEDDSPEALVDNLFTAMRVFNDCLSDEGTSFIGAPNPAAEPDDPVNDPSYLAALQKCAALSNIQEAFANFQSASEDLTQEEIQERNEGLVLWADCMEGRGWLIGELQADAQGLLSPGELTPPDGESVFDSDDLQECASTAIDEATDDEAVE